LDLKLRALSIILILQVAGFIIFSIIWAQSDFHRSDGLDVFIGLMTLFFFFMLVAWIIGNFVVFFRYRDGPGVCRDCIRDAAPAPPAVNRTMLQSIDSPQLSSEYGYQPPRVRSKPLDEERQIRQAELNLEIRSHAKMLVEREPLLGPIVQGKLDGCPDSVSCLMELENLEMALNHIEDILPYGDIEDIARAYERLGLRDKAIETRFSGAVRANKSGAEKAKPPPTPARPASLGMLDDYHIIERIGSGGFCDVYVVERSGTKYALKIPKGIDLSGKVTVRIDEGSIEKFHEEATIWAELTSKAPDCIVRLIDSGVEPFPWFVMDLAEKDLGSAMPTLDFSEKMAVVLSLIDKLQRIHSLNIVHRDIKPENILLVNGVWKFTDFGLSKLTGNSSMSSVNLKGTLNYLAPEQVSKTKFGPVDQRTDIWQMAVLIAFMTGGTLPFKCDDPNETILSILTDEPDLSNTPEIIRTILAKALRKDREERWQNCIEMRCALLGALDNNNR
jgi:hypothetical protein